MARCRGFVFLMGTCASGYHDGGNGACVLQEDCSDGYHNGGLGFLFGRGQL